MSNENLEPSIDFDEDDDETTPQAQNQQFEPPTPDPKPEPKPKPEPPKKRIFSRADIVRSIPVKVYSPSLYPDFEPWSFKLRLKLSSDAEKRRQEYLALSSSDMVTKEAEHNLDELTDLLVEMPTGFDDLRDTGKGAGHSFKSYVNTADEETREFLDTIIAGAVNLYWNKLMPREFRG